MHMTDGQDTAEGGCATSQSAAAEIAALEGLVSELERALALEQAAGCNLARWGAWSHDWNRRRHVLQERLLWCPENGLAHRRAHQACGHLFPAWQRIHYEITRQKPADILGLEEVKRRLSEAVAAQAGARGRDGA
jgi:hypothetical protein